jgi:hypothetical protein
MKCPDLIKLILSLCKAGGKIYAPNFHELQEYCRTRDHVRCPLFIEHYDKEEGEDS